MRLVQLCGFLPAPLAPLTPPDAMALLSELSLQGKARAAPSWPTGQATH